MTPLRAIFNSAHAFQINFKIQEKLIAPFEQEMPKSANIQWREFKDIFYEIVDNDNTLTMRSKKIRFNGTLWTSSADLRAISVVGIAVTIISIFLHVLGVCDSFDFPVLIQNLVIYFFISLISVFISKRLTAKHGELSEDQCEFIIKNHREKLRQGIQGMIGNNG